MSTINNETNLDYQTADSPLGGSYTEKKLNRLMLPNLAGLRFLDLGCNAGYYCEFALRSGAKRVVGVDVDKNVIGRARQRLSEVEFHDEGWDNDFPVGPFDVVILLSAIHYAADPVSVVKKIFDELAPGGLLVLEGGLIDPQGEERSDILVPGWRQVGDRCRHLTHGYLTNHLLASFDWDVVGSSEPRGGDEVPRYVIHARKAVQRPRRSLHTLDLLEYANAIALSANTIVDAQPALAYLRLWRNSSQSGYNSLVSVVNDPELLQLFIADLAYALEPSKILPIELLPVLPPNSLSAVIDGLSSLGYTVQKAKNEANVVSNSQEKRLVDFVEVLPQLPDNSRYGDLKDKVVADLGVCDPRLHEVILAAGAKRILSIGMPGLTPTDKRIVAVPGDPLDATLPEKADIAFLDSRYCPEFDNVTSLTRLVGQMRRSLKTDATVFAMLKTGDVIGGFDIHNPIVSGVSGLLPSNEYFFNELLSECTVRIVSHVPASRPYELLRLFRLSLKRPTLLLILGRSHSGKTSLARDFLKLDSAMHVSNDYIYTELVARAREGHAGLYPVELIEIAGDGSGAACGQFNRALENDPNILQQYMSFIVPFLPRNKRVVSMDFDLGAESQVELAKEALTKAGFSVWVVRR